MKKITFIIMFCIQAMVLNARTTISAKKLTINFNQNIELLGLAYFIGFEGVDIEDQVVEINGKSVPKKEWHKYGFYLYGKYKKYATSVNLASSFAVADHLWLDYIINLLVQVDDFPNAHLTPDIKPKYFINFSKKKDTAEAIQNARIFLEGLNNFYNEINFKQYTDDTKPLYTSALNQVKAHLPQKDIIKAMETFYEKSFDRYTLVPSLTIPKGMGFGLNYTKDGITTLINVFGAFDQQSVRKTNKWNLGFGNPQRLQELSIHEFGHSFVNPIIDSIPKGMIDNTERLFVPIRSAMERQGYNTWKACLYEHFVRAGEVLIAKSLGDSSSAQWLLTNYINDRRFVYLTTIIAELEDMKKQKVSYYAAVSKAMEGLITYINR